MLTRFIDTIENRFDPFLVAATNEHVFSRTMFYSLLNTCVTYDPNGWGIPYASMVGSDEQTNLLDISLQVHYCSRPCTKRCFSFRYCLCFLIFEIK